MDTLTHALSGALLARASYREEQRLGLTARTLVGALACAFPDSDFVLRWVDILYYFNWHRGVTHSLVLLPLWALAGAVLLWLGSRRRWPIRELLVLLALSLGLHILGDLITAYGTRIYMPLSTARVGWNTTFIIDLVFSGILVAGLVESWRGRAVAGARYFLGVLVIYVAFQAVLQQRALALAEAHAATVPRATGRIVALPQPLSPLNWKLIVEEDSRYHVAYVRLWGEATTPGWLAWLQPAMRHYHNPDQLVWETVYRFGTGQPRADLARVVWEEQAFADYRLFAGFPRLYRIDEDPQHPCVWFTDERFVLPGMTPPFRFGLCQNRREGPWTLHQLPPRIGPEPELTSAQSPPVRGVPLRPDRTAPVR